MQNRLSLLLFLAKLLCSSNASVKHSWGKDSYMRLNIGLAAAGPADMALLHGD